MENKKVEKYYIDSEGKKLAISTMHPTHIKNAMLKKYDELFLCKTKDEFSKKLQEVNDLKDGYYKHINDYYEGLSD